MTRWLPLPVDCARSVDLGTASLGARLVWLALRVVHAEHGLGGVIPAKQATAEALKFSAPALLADVDVDAALQELHVQGLVEESEHREGGVRLVDFSDCEMQKCSRCGRRNPNPRSGRCSRCREDDRKRYAQKVGVDAEVCAEAGNDDSEGGAQNKRSDSAANAQRCAEKRSATDPTDPTDQTRPDPTDQTDGSVRNGSERWMGAGRAGPVADQVQRVVRSAAEARADPHVPELLRILCDETQVRSESRSRRSDLTCAAIDLARDRVTPDELRRLVEIAQGKRSPDGWLNTVLKHRSWAKELR